MKKKVASPAPVVARKRTKEPKLPTPEPTFKVWKIFKHDDPYTHDALIGVSRSAPDLSAFPEGATTVECSMTEAQWALVENKV